VKAYPPEAREDVADLRALGWGYKRIADHLGMSHTTVRRWVDPAYAAEMRTQARARKKKLQGTCCDCGAWTCLRSDSTPAERCVACDLKYRRENRVWTRESVIEAVRWAHGELDRPLRTRDFHTERVDGLPAWNTLRNLGLFPRTACALAGVPFYSGWKGVGARGGSKHGSASRYSAGCRCDECRGANNAYQRAHYAAKKAAAMQG
jgi:hypothetical protein